MSRPHPEMSRDYWEGRWSGGDHPEAQVAHPCLVPELGALTPGTALDAGCGAGNEAIWLAQRGWTTTGADLAPSALARAAERAAAAGVDVTWVEADLSAWTPQQPFDLVTTFYAHPTGDQLDFYRRIADWVAPGGTLLIVGHLHPGGHGGHGGTDGHHQPPEETTVTADRVAALLPSGKWRVESSLETPREVLDGQGRSRLLHDAVVRATRLR